MFRGWLHVGAAIIWFTVLQCGNQNNKSDKILIGVGITNSQHSYYIELTRGYKEAAAAMGVDIIINDAKFDAANQASAMEDFLTRGVKSIIVAPVTPGSLEPFAEEAQKEKVPLIAESSEIKGQTCFVATDNYRGGFIGGEYAGKVLKEKGIRNPKIAYLGAPKFPVCILREKGFIDGMKKVLPGAELVALQDGEGIMEVSLTVAENILQANPRLDCIGAINDASALGALAALEASHRVDPIIIGFDGGEDGRAAIRRGSNMIASSAQRPLLIAHASMEMAVKAAKGDSVPPVVQIEPVLVTRENLDEFEKNMMLAK